MITDKQKEFQDLYSRYQYDFSGALREIMEARRKIALLKEDAERLADLVLCLMKSVEEFYEQNEVENPEYQAANEVCLFGHENTLDRHNQIMKEVE